MTTSQEGRLSSTRQLFSLVYAWSLLRAPETFTLTLIAMAAVLSLAFIIPQQPPYLSDGSADAQAIWIVSLPGFYQRTATIFQASGLFRIFETPWFWLPAGILVLIALVVLADYTPLVKQRLVGSGSASDVPHPHPFNQRHTQSIRAPAPIEANLSAASGDPIAQLQTSLAEAGYQVYHANGQDLRIFARRRFRWGAPLLVMAGILLLMFGVLIQSLWGDHQTFDLSIAKKETAHLNEHTVRVQNFSAHMDGLEQPSGGEITVDVGQKPQTWPLYQPQRLDGWWVIPADIQPTAEIRLALPSQPEQRLEATFPTMAEPAAFIFPQQNLRFALYYRSAGNRPDYELIATKLDGSEAPIIEQNGIAFYVPAYELRGEVRVSETLHMQAYRIPGLPVIALGLLSILLGLILLILPTPSMIWVRLVTKGRGSRIEAEVEVLQDMPPFDDDFSEALALLLPYSPAMEEANGR